MKIHLIAFGAVALLTATANAEPANSTQAQPAPVIHEKPLGQMPVRTIETTGSATTATNQLGCREITIRTPQAGATATIRKIYECD